MYRGKFVAAALSMIMAGAAESRAQGARDLWPPYGGGSISSATNYVSLAVRDRNGAAIAGATVISPYGMDAATDSSGIISVRFWSDQRTPVMLDVRALGYDHANVLVYPGVDNRLEVTLSRAVSDSSSVRTEPNVSAKELSPSVQKKSAALQEQASKAFKHRDYATAELLLKRSLELTPSCASIYNSIGITYLRRNQIEEAASWVKRAAQAAPYQPAIIGNLGVIRWMQSRHDESFELLRRAEELGYESPMGHYILGIDCLRKGLNKAAVVHLKKPSARDFPYRDLYLAIALRACGKTRASDESYRSFLQRNPTAKISPHP